MTEIVLKYNTGLRRLGAAIIDTLVFAPLIIADKLIRDTFENKIGILLWLTIITAITILYSVYFHLKFGQTVGKMVAKVKVVDISETKNISLKQALLRDSVYIIFEIIRLGYFATLIMKFLMPTSNLLEDYDDFGMIISLVWVGLELTSMLTNSKKRAIHDFLAGTVVIRTRIDSKKVPNE